VKNVNSLSPLSWGVYTSTINNSDEFISRYFHFLRIQTIIEHFQQGSIKTTYKRCLDIGCNRGYYSVILAECGMVVDAIDNNLDISKVTPHPNIHYYATDILNFESKETYDLVLFFEVLEHIQVEDRKVVLEKIHSLLATEGILMFSGLNCFSFLYGAGFCKESILNLLKARSDINWHYHIPFYSYTSVLKSSGFCILNWNTNGVFPIILNGMEGFFNRFVDQICNTDQNLSKILKGLGANYYCIAKKIPQLSEP